MSTWCPATKYFQRPRESQAKDIRLHQICQSTRRAWEMLWITSSSRNFLETDLGKRMERWSRRDMTCCGAYCGVIESQMGGYDIRVSEDKIGKVKRNWSAPGPDAICNYWVKKITVLHQPLGTVMGKLLNEDASLPTWVNRGRTSLIPKEGEWDTANHRPNTNMLEHYI